MNIIQRIWFNQPVAFVATIQTLIALFVAFGLELTANQVGAILAAVTSVGGLIAKTAVTPTAKLQVYADAVEADRIANIPPEVP